MKPRKSSIYADFRARQSSHKGAYRKLARGRSEVGKAIRAKVGSAFSPGTSLVLVGKMPGAVRCWFRATRAVPLIPL